MEQSITCIFHMRHKTLNVETGIFQNKICKTYCESKLNILYKITTLNNLMETCSMIKCSSEEDVGDEMVIGAENRIGEPRCLHLLRINVVGKGMNPLLWLIGFSSFSGWQSSRRRLNLNNE